MTDLEQLLVRELADRADAVPVGPLPLDRMVREAAVRRRRPRVALLAAAAAAVVVGGLAVVLPSEETRPDPAPPLGSPPPSSTAPSVPPAVGTGRVGVGHLSVEVPTGSAQVTPTTFDPRMISSYAWELRPRLVDGARVLSAEPVRAGWDPQRVWRAVVWLPSEQVGLVVDSPDGAAEVEAVLATLGVDPDLVGVPPVVAEDRTPLRGAAYLALLKGAGLAAEVSVDGGAGEQRVDAVTPEAGTMVPVGSTVEVRLVPQEPMTRP